MSKDGVSTCPYFLVFGLNTDQKNSVLHLFHAVKIIKGNVDIFTDFIDFTSFVKLTNVIPVFKKECKNSKDNYRPISVMKNIFKTYKIILFKQIRNFA